MKKTHLLLVVITTLSLFSCGGFNQGFGKQKFLKGNLKQVFGTQSEVEEVDSKNQDLVFETTEEAANSSILSEDEEPEEIFKNELQDEMTEHHEKLERSIKHEHLEKGLSKAESETNSTNQNERQYYGADWVGSLVGLLGFIIILGGFALIILTTILPWWWFLIGLGTIFVGCLLLAAGAELVGGKGAGLGAALAGIIAFLIGGISLVVWGLVELILWLIG
ncbi:MAG: hypothetical protein BM555_01355 [Crocinitomix sp. MedPE-SWsnd]|nr:MAG: hypothetical protein BM555_01355 [Crocinitomix sp. MedPE-SWsnd]